MESRAVQTAFPAEEELLEQFDARFSRIWSGAGMCVNRPLKSLTGVEYVFLARLGKLAGPQQQEVAVGALGACLPHGKSAVSKMLGVLENKGLVLRRPSPENRRKVLIRITPDGWEALEQERRARRERNRAVIRLMGRDRAAEMLDLLEEYMQLVREKSEA